ncbi:transposase, partial [Escherichia coli]
MRLKRPLKTGMDEIVLDPFELMRRLAAVVPQPGVHEIHYYGVFGSHSALRPHIVPRSPRRARSCPSDIHSHAHDDRQM